MIVRARLGLMVARLRSLMSTARFVLVLVVRGVARAVVALLRTWTGRRGLANLRTPASDPLPSLFIEHPEVGRASRRELGLRTVPVEDIRGTAVEGPDQRGGDFLPLPRFRSRNWAGRWQRILRGIDRLETLPPVELVKFGDSYWVVDGHNRVAAALRVGQVGVDAVVTELRLPGMPAEPAPTALAAVISEGKPLRHMGAGRLSTTASLPDVEPPVPMQHDHGGIDEHDQTPHSPDQPHEGRVEPAQ